MGQFSKVLQLLIMHTQHHREGPHCGPGLGGLNQVYGPNHPTPSVQGIRGEYINIFTRCTIKNQHDILTTAVADVSKEQTHMSYKGELQTLTKLSMRHQVCLSDTCRMIISESILTMLMSRGRSNCGVAYYVSVYY